MKYLNVQPLTVTATNNIPFSYVVEAHRTLNADIPPHSE